MQRTGRVAPSRSTVLVTGESGTGKELVARALHIASDRKEIPLRMHFGYVVTISAAGILKYNINTLVGDRAILDIIAIAGVAL